MRQRGLVEEMNQQPINEIFEKYKHLDGVLSGNAPRINNFNAVY